MICITGVGFQSNFSTAAESAESISFVVALTIPSDTVLTVQVYTEEATPIPSAEGLLMWFWPLMLAR